MMTSVMLSRYAYRSWYRPCTVENTTWCIVIDPSCPPTAT